ncbi:MAG: methylated-DNA--[protein]-cysteine S-methyltransferase [Armatimonadetes bacterium]|nr:methylated-DNA--[protein]-cysteine S-methyltransferase [Armatimonadota bacterium]
MQSTSFDRFYTALERRSDEFDGLVFTAVKTTGIFCRPICPARTPLPQNVEFFQSAAEALAAGYRPCKRCHPMEMGADAPEWLVDLKREVDLNPAVRLSDKDLRGKNLDPVTVRRAFRRRYGVTFQEYQRKARIGAGLVEMQGGGDTVDAAMTSGYQSESGFRDAFQKCVGESPRRATDLTPAWTKFLETEVGPMVAVATDDGLEFLEFIDRNRMEAQIHAVIRDRGCTLVSGTHRYTEQIEQELREYFLGQRTVFTVPTVIKGSPFQEKVWRVLQSIPYGETQSYAWLAKQVGSANATRAVGTANGENRMAIIIPCHRIIRSDGSLGGYAGGLWRKKKLLELENPKGSLELYDCL